MALAMVASALLASSASAAKPVLKPTAYIALGDSLAFGYKEQTFNENLPTEPTSAYEIGYVGDLAKKLTALEKKAGNALTLINEGCPGETSGGLIGNGPLGTAIEEGRAAKEEFPLKVSAPCAYHNVAGFPLKAEIGSASELEGALGVLASGAEVKLVTLNIGSNDELETVGKCENPAYDEEQGFAGGLFECITVEAGLEGHEYPGGLFTHVITDVGTSIGVLRNAGYEGPIAVLGFYNPQAIILPGSDALQIKLNEAFEGTIGAGKFGPGVVYANPFPKFNPQKKVSVEQKAICKYTEECNTLDKHVNFVKYLEGKGLSHEEAEGAATAEESKGFVFPEGDIHPTAKGYKLLAKYLETSLGL
jgi:lysophospholipase L1-like esterase